MGAAFNTEKVHYNAKWNSVQNLLSCAQTICNPMEYSPPSSSVHGILQARTLQWVAIPFSRRSSPGSNLGLSLHEQTLHCLSNQGDSNHYFFLIDCQNRRAWFHPWVTKIEEFISSVLSDWISYPSLIPSACAKSCPPSWWCYLIVFPNVVPSYSHLQSFPAPEKSPRKPIHSYENLTDQNQSWIFLGRTDADTETPIVCPPDAKNWFTGNNPDAR